MPVRNIIGIITMYVITSSTSAATKPFSQVLTRDITFGSTDFDRPALKRDRGSK